MSSYLLNTNTEVVEIDSRYKSGTVTLPRCSHILKRILTFKDIYGAAYNSTITIETQGDDLFENGSQTYQINVNFGSVTLYVGSSNTWNVLTGSALDSLVVNGLYTSTIQISSYTIAPISNTLAIQHNGSNFLTVSNSGTLTLSSLRASSLFLYDTGVLSNVSLQISSSFLFANNTLVSGGSASVTPSSLTGLGTLGYVSTASLQSSLEGLGSLGYLSTALVTPSSLEGLGSLGYVSTASLQSSLTGLGTLGYVSTASLQSSLTGLGTLAYVSTASLQSTVTGLGALGYVSTSYLQSTIAGLGSLGYLSTSGTSSDYINSTVTGLGTLGYVSTASLQSSLEGLGSLGYLSTALVTPSSLTGLGTLGYVSTASLQSTVTGLGTLAYISTASLQSTVIGLGSLGYLSTASVTPSSLTGLGTLGYVSTASLQSTVTGLGSLGYLSTALNATTISSLTVSTFALSTFTLFTQGSNSLVITNSNPGNFIVSSMNLGINTTQPQYPLDVNGIANFSSISLGAGDISLLARFKSLAIGYQVGTYGLGSNTLALGYQAGFSNQGQSGTAIGMTAGAYSQGLYGIAVGDAAGYSNQGLYGTAIGYQAGFVAQCNHAVALGYTAGYSNQGSNTVAIGNSAGFSNQTTNSIAIGWLAGQGTTATSSIILNASGAALNTTTPGLFVSPIRLITGAGNITSFNTITSEISYSDTAQLSTITTLRLGAGGPTNASNALLVTGSQSNTGDLFVGGSVRATGVGINCNAPSYGLDVNGTTNLNGVVRFKTSVSHIGDDGLTKVFYAPNSATYYLAPSHVFQNQGGVNTFTVDSSGNAGINNASPQTGFNFDVNGPMQAAIYYSSITAGGTMTVTPNNFGIFYNITATGTYTLAFSATQASSNIGKYVSFRNNSGTTLSLTLTGVSGITSPVTLSNAQSASFVVATTNTYALF